MWVSIKVSGYLSGYLSQYQSIRIYYNNIIMIGGDTFIEVRVQAVRL